MRQKYQLEALSARNYRSTKHNRRFDACGTAGEFNAEVYARAENLII